MAKNKYVLKRHKFVYGVLHFLLFLVSRINWGYRSKAKYKIKKGETVLVLSNHQTDLDPLCILPSFNRPVYPVGTDSLFAGKLASHFFGKTLGMIPKRKGAADLRASVAMFQTIQEGGSLLLFPEGNRTYAEFQYFISPNFAKFVKSLKSTLILFRLEGGTGTQPRFKHKKRRGKFTGKIAQVLKYEEYKDMPDEELLHLIQESIKVYDSESGNLYKSKKRAEYLERMFFVCPKCGAMHQMYSHKEHFTCKACGFDMTYGEDLHLHSNDPEFKYSKMLDYWNYQKRLIKAMNIVPGEIIFKDDNIRLYQANPYEKKVLLHKGSVALTDQELIFGELKLPVHDIASCSTISGIKLSFNIGDTTYLIKGHKRFNPLKYNFIFNKLDTVMKEKHNDDYFNLEEN